MLLPPLLQCLGLAKPESVAARFSSFVRAKDYFTSGLQALTPDGGLTLATGVEKPVRVAIAYEDKLFSRSVCEGAKARLQGALYTE